MTRSYIPIYNDVLGLQLTDAVIDGSYLVIGPSEAVALASDLIQWKRQVVDTFYVKDMFGLKYHSLSKQKALEKKLRQAITDGTERADT